MGQGFKNDRLTQDVKDCSEFETYLISRVGKDKEDAREGLISFYVRLCNRTRKYPKE